jgi:hypothetical protein
MTRAGDDDEIGYGASVAYLSDAARRRAERGDPSPDDAAPAPDPDAGIELITSLDAGEDDVEESVDDALERALARRHGAPDAAPGVLPVPETRERESRVDPAGPREGEQRGVREALEHHHERRDPRAPATITPRGSADLPPRAPQPSTSSDSRSPVKTLRPARLRWRVAGSLAAVVLLVVIVAIGLVVSSSTARHHRAPAAVTRAAMQNVATPISLIALKSREATATIDAEAETAVSAHAAIQANARTKARAKARARARAKAARRARAAAARRRRAAAQRAHAASTPGPAAAVSTPTSATDPVSTTPTSSTSSASTDSSSASGGGSGSSSAPPGPTAIGSAGSNCNPKCS